MKKNGFTLIELLVSMGIIAVLSGMAVFNFNQARMRARDVQRKSDLSQLQKALELYKNDNDARYPSAIDFQNTLVNGGYAKTTFMDPQGSSWYTYLYQPNAGLTTYSITACLETRSDTTRVEGQYCGPSESGVKYIITNP